MSKTKDVKNNSGTGGFIREHYVLMAGLAVFILGTAVRFLMRDMTSLDTELYLVPWYEEIKNGGGFAMLGQQVGDYNILYQTIIAVFTCLPLHPLHAYKLFSGFFDLLLALLAAFVVYRTSDKNGKQRALVTFGIVFLSPIVMLNSAWWAQCDAIYTFFALACLYFLSKRQDAAGVLMYGVSITFKLQAVFLLPAVLFVLFCHKKRNVLYLVLVPLVMIILSLPGLLSGRSVTDVFTIYFSQTQTYKSLALNYPSLWGIPADIGHLINGITLANTVTDEWMYRIFKYPALLLTAGVLVGYLCYFVRKKEKRISLLCSPKAEKGGLRAESEAVFSIAFLIVYTCVIFLPGMHERYGYMYEILALILLWHHRRTLVPMILMYTVTLMTYIMYLSNCYFIPISVLSVINLAVYFMYVRRLFFTE